MGVEMIVLVIIKKFRKMIQTLIMCFITTKIHQLIFKKKTLYPILSQGISFRPAAHAPFTGIANVEITDDSNPNSRLQVINVFIKENVPEDEEEIKKIMTAGRWEDNGFCGLNA